MLVLIAAVQLVGIVGALAICVRKSTVAAAKKATALSRSVKTSTSGSLPQLTTSEDAPLHDHKPEQKAMDITAILRAIEERDNKILEDMDRDGLHTRLFPKEEEPEVEDDYGSGSTAGRDPREMAYTQFALTSFRAAAAPSDKNVVLSPSSLGTLLALLMEGSGGATKNELAHFLGQGVESLDAISSYYSKLNSRICATTTAASPVVARASNHIFIDQKFVMKGEYATRVQAYDATIHSYDLTDGAHSAKIVNDIISSATSGRFPQLTSADAYTDVTALYLISTITFEAEWADKFNHMNTESSGFRGLAGDRKELYMYKQFCHSHCSYTKKLTTIKMVYADPSWALYLLMPAMNTFKAWLGALTAASLRAAMESVKRKDFEVYVPRFSMDVSVDCKAILEGAGVNKCFTPLVADLSSITSTAPLCVDKVTQTILFAVDEDGTRAAAASMAYASLCPRQSVRFNRPFIFVLAKESTPVFIGQFV